MSRRDALGYGSVWLRARSESRMTFTQRRITPARRPRAATAIGVKTAISE